MINTDPAHLNVKNEFIRIKPGYENRALGIQVLNQQVLTLSQHRFKKTYCPKFERSSMPLHKLLLEKQLTLWADGKERKMSGRQYWIEYGSWWNGEFKLGEKSENVKRLKDYLLGRLLKSKQKIYAIN